MNYQNTNLKRTLILLNLVCLLTLGKDAWGYDPTLPDGVGFSEGFPHSHIEKKRALGRLLFKGAVKTINGIKYISYRGHTYSYLAWSQLSTGSETAKKNTVMPLMAANYILQVGISFKDTTNNRIVRVLLDVGGVILSGPNEKPSNVVMGVLTQDKVREFMASGRFRLLF